MANSLEVVRRLDRTNPLADLSLPAWLQSSLRGLTVGSIEVTREDGIKARMVVPTIVRSLSLSTSARTAIERRAGELAAALVAFDTDALATHVADMLSGFTAQNLGEAAQRGRARSFLQALDDLPAWAVADACRRWLRREAGTEFNYAFPPTPPILRELAMISRLRVATQLEQLRKLLNARVVDDTPAFTDEHRAEMLGKLQALMAGIGKDEPPAANHQPAGKEAAE